MEIDPARTSTTARDFLSYCYYGGMVHMGAFTLRQPPGACLPRLLQCDGMLCDGACIEHTVAGRSLTEPAK